MIILLDLNYTLVANSNTKVKPFTKQIAGEIYRRDLINIIKNHTIVLMTARPALHADRTRESLMLKEGWLPDYMFFNKYGMSPPDAKKKMLKNDVLDIIGNDDVVAIESNPKTKSMYAGYGITSFTYQEFMDNANTKKLDI